jgi:hypothetical protein
MEQCFLQRLKIVQIILLFPQSALWGFLLHSNDWRLRASDQLLLLLD